MKKFCVAFIVLFAISGCGSSEDTVPPGATEVRFWHAMSGPLGDTMLKIIKRFNQENPDVHVTPVYQGGYAQLSQKIIGAVMANSAPDIAQVYESWVAKLNATKGEEAILALDDFIAADPEIRMEDVYPVLIRNVTQGGKILSMPFNKSFPVLFYNRDLFAKEGLDPDDPPETWDEFVRVARHLTRDENGDGTPDQWGWAFNIDSWLIEGFLLQRGRPLIDPDTGKAQFDTPEGRDALQFLVDASTGPKRFAYRVTGYDHQMGFANQKIAMIITSSVSRLFMRDRLHFDYGIAPIPRGERPAAILAGTNVAMFKAARPEVRKAAWRFMKYFMSPKVTAYWARKTNYMPVRPSALEVPEMKEHLQRDPNAWAAIKQMDWAYFEPRLPAWYECRQILNSMLERVLAEPKRLDEFLGQANREIDKKLAKEDTRHK